LQLTKGCLPGGGLKKVNENEGWQELGNRGGGMKSRASISMGEGPINGLIGRLMPARVSAMMEGE